MKTPISRFIANYSLMAGIAIALGGCAANQDNVLAVTGTVVGLQIHQKDADKTPEFKVGYARTEFAFVPTNRRTRSKDCCAGSAEDSAEVLMEINAEGNLGLGTAYQGGIYQRLAVGRTAVSQPGAALMMSKDRKGIIDSNTASVVARATQMGFTETKAAMLTLDSAAAKLFEQKEQGQRKQLAIKALKGVNLGGRSIDEVSKSISEADSVQKIRYVLDDFYVDASLIASNLAKE